MLVEAFSHKWPDPSLSKTYEEFHKQYSEQYGRAIAYKEVFELIETAETQAFNLAERMKDPEKDFSLGTRKRNDRKTPAN